MLARRREDFFEPFVELQREIDKLFDDFVRPLRTVSYLPKVDVYETDDKVVLEFEVPGVNKEDLKISYSDGVLKVCGEKKAEKNDEKRDYKMVERYYGKFERSFILPEYVDPKKISAKYTDGVLKVEIPKIEKKEEEIEIKVE